MSRSIIYVHVFIILDFCSDLPIRMLMSTTNSKMTVFFVKSNINTYLKARALYANVHTCPSNENRMLSCNVLQKYT